MSPAVVFECLNRFSEDWEKFEDDERLDRTLTARTEDIRKLIRLW